MDLILAFFLHGSEFKSIMTVSNQSKVIVQNNCSATAVKTKTKTKSKSPCTGGKWVTRKTEDEQQIQKYEHLTNFMEIMLLQRPKTHLLQTKQG